MSNTDIHSTAAATEEDNLDSLVDKSVTMTFCQNGACYKCAIKKKGYLKSIPNCVAYTNILPVFQKTQIDYYKKNFECPTCGKLKVTFKLDAV